MNSSTNNLTHEQIRAYLQEAETINAETRPSIEHHLAGCNECRIFAETLNRLENGSWNPYPKRQLNPREVQAVLQNIAPRTAQTTIQTRAIAHTPNRQPFGLRRWAALGITTLGVLVAGIFLFLLQSNGGGLALTPIKGEPQQVGQVANEGSEVLATLPAVLVDRPVIGATETPAEGGIVSLTDKENEPVVLPPRGLIYRHNTGYWRIDEGGKPQRLTDEDPHSPYLTFSPSGQRAFRVGQHGANYWIYTFTPGGATIEGYPSDYPRTLIIGWLDEQAAIVSIQYEGEPLQNGLGHLAILDVGQNEVQMLEPDEFLQRPPQVLPDGTMVYQRGDEIVLWRGDEAGDEIASISIESLNLPGDLLQFALSPDGSQMVSLVQGKFDNDEWAYINSDLNGYGQQILHTTTPFSIETVLPLGITWSPDSRWVVLVPLTASLNEPLTGPQILLVSSDGSQKKKLGQGVGLFTEWVSSDTLLFMTGWSESELETYLYHIDTGEKQKIALPAGAEPVQLVQKKRQRATVEPEQTMTPDQSATVSSGITWPVAGTIITGTVSIMGTASVALLTFYRLSYKLSSEEDDTYVYFDRGGTPVINGELGLWETKWMDPGIYTLRLEVVQQNGNYAEYFVEDIEVVEQVINLSSQIPQQSETEPMNHLPSFYILINMAFVAIMLSACGNSPLALLRQEVPPSAPELVEIRLGSTNTEVDICVTLPSTGDWIPRSKLIVGERITKMGGMGLIGWRTMDFSDPHHCYTLMFDIALTEADAAIAAVEIRYFVVSMSEMITGEDCDNAHVKLRGLNPEVQFRCTPHPQTPGFAPEIIQKPDELTEVEAYALLEQSFGDVYERPWVFPLTSDKEQVQPVTPSQETETPE